MTFLEICQDFVSELGVANGTGPNSVLNQTGEYRNVVRWIRDSSLWIDNNWKDWKYLKLEYFGVLGTNNEISLDRFAPAPNNPPGVLVRRWDKDSMWIDKQGITASPLAFVEWDRFRQLYDTSRDLPNQRSKPTTFTIRPDNTIQTFPIADALYTMSGEFWRRPPVLKVDNDTPLMPAEFHRLIVCRAAIMYGNREDAPEIISGMETEYDTLLPMLQADQLPGFDLEGMSTQDQLIDVTIPGCGI